ncbi:MAG: DUF4139 domain-containing protein [Candidatus Omnitrophica bacterium]|nr:DUF4139 domain-containing protein [Candidatus Omnitrophota bacterium]
MRKKFLLFILAFVLVCGYARADEVLKTTLDDQTDVEVTVYNSNLGLVKDTRSVSLPPAEGKELRFMDVAAYINPATVHVKSLNAADSFSVWEQNYEYDLISDSKLLDKFVGKKIKLIEKNQYQDTTKTIEATLLSNNSGQIYQIDKEIYLGYPGMRVLPEIPENLIAKPTLMWLYSSKEDLKHDLQVSYLTDNISWKADYILVVDKEDKSADLSGWVTIDNKSGTIYEKAKLKLVAGEVNQVSPIRMKKANVFERQEQMDGFGGSQFVEKGLFEYHLYDLQRRTTIKDNQTKQISLLEANNVSVTKEMLLIGQESFYMSRYQGKIPKQAINVYIKFKNEEKNKLGMPLPAGIMRLYKKDQEESLQFVGEDKIEHTPKDEEIKLLVGEAFDVVAERVQTDFKQITTRMYESSWEITLRNHKEEDVTIGVVEPLHGNWNIVFSSLPFEKKDAFTVQFNAAVPKNGEVKVNYTVRVGID